MPFFRLNLAIDINDEISKEIPLARINGPHAKKPSEFKMVKMASVKNAITTSVTIVAAVDTPTPNQRASDCSQAAVGESENRASEAMYGASFFCSEGVSIVCCVNSTAGFLYPKPLAVRAPERGANKQHAQKKRLAAVVSHKNSSELQV